ncbi:MAG: DUF11 domain-containing protein [Protaetiibacter sp.]
MSHVAATTVGLPSRRFGRRRRDGRRWLALVLAPAVLLSSIGLTVWGGGVLSATAAIAEPEASISQSDVVLAGEDVVFSVSLTNTDDADGYNIAFAVLIPNGVTFVSSGMGTPTIYASGATLPNSSVDDSDLETVPDGYQLWVFEDVADLPSGATYSSTITVRPDAEEFPVGSTLEAELTGYVSSDSALLPVFDGSTGVSGEDGAEATSSDESEAEVAIEALRVTKSEPSPEDELLRGVHDNQTVYTLTIENTPQGDTNDVTVVDYLPAGLEFLGCGTVDNTEPSSLLAGTDGTEEYEGSGDLTGTAPDDCLTPTSVETVEVDGAIYTKVTWTISSLSGTTAQDYPDSAGVAGVTTIRYLAAVPLFENTMDFVTDAGSGTPDPESLEQAANLNNNNGASTRQGQDDADYDDGILYVNSVTVTGSYQGDVAEGTSTTVSASDTEQIIAMDLRVLKSVETGADDGTGFVTGGLATFTLTLDTSEYASADGITLVDTLPNGLCPALPDYDGDTSSWPSECQSMDDDGTVLTGATVTSIVYDADTGEFAITFVPDGTLAANDTLEISYTAYMRSSYDGQGNTSSGDSLVNTVEIEGTTTAIDALEDVTNGSGVSAGGEETVWDDSSAEITSDLSSISKRVLDRDAVVEGSESADTACAVDSSDAAWAENLVDDDDTVFHQGDLVCYELTVDFASQIDVRNPIVTDFLPTDVEYLDWAVYSGDGIEVATPTVSGQRIQWLVGTTGDDGDRFVPLGSTLVLHVLGRLTDMTSASSSSLDKPENLMKYRQENVDGEVFFERDSSAISVGQAPTLLKGVWDVNGDTTLPALSQDLGDGDEFDSNRDGIEVVQDDVVSYRIDLTGGDTDAAVTVWDALPAGVTADDVSGITDGGVALDPGDAGYPSDIEDPTRSVVIWTGIDVAAGAERTLSYDVTVPEGVEINTTLTNTASITSYDVELNSGETGTFYPDGSLDTGDHDADVVVPGDGTRDDSAVYTPPASIDKWLVESEVGTSTTDLDTQNTDSVIVQGELVTYSYSVTIPAHTTVANGVLRDRGTLVSSAGGTVTLTVTDAGWDYSALTDAVESDFTFASTSGSYRGVLTFPSSYTNSSDEAQVFTVTLTGYVGDAGSNGVTLTNQGQFTSDTWSGTDDQAVTYREPNLDITKTASKTSGVAYGDSVTYTLTVTNNTNRVKSYDNVVVDTVPAGLIVDASSIDPVPASYDSGITTGAGGTITWTIDELPPTATLSYAATIDPETGAAQSYLNTATVTGYTLPEEVDGVDTTGRRGTRSDTATATITAATAAIDKGVRLVGGSSYAATASAPIGDTVEYQVVVTLRAGVNYYDPVITDDLPAGVQLVESSVSGPTASDTTTIPGTWTLTQDTTTNTWTWTYDGDIPSSTSERTLTLSYQVLLADDVAASVTSLPNTAAFSWNRTDDTESTRTSLTDGATVTVLDPVLAIDKTVSDAAPDPGDTFDYTVTVTNTGTTPAYNMVVTDVIPDGVIVDPDTISGGGTISGQTATGGGTITWDADDLPGPLYQQGSSSTPLSITLTYSATLAASAGLGDTETFTNTASVTSFESFDEGGRVYTPSNVSDTATVDPPFPNVTLDKTTTSGDIAYADESFGWTLTLVNTGDGDAQTIAVTDVLPKNWSFDTGSALITVGTGAQATLADPSITTTDGVQTLTWSTDQISATTPALPGTASGATLAQRTIVITFTATPSEDALTDAGVTTDAGVRVAHVNTLSAVTTDASGATGNESGSYTAEDDTASAYIHSADLTITKTAADSALVAGTSGTGWSIVVTNDGPDPAVGPITVSDTTAALPDGIVVTGVSGTGWNCATPVRGTDGVTTIECERTDANESLASGASFPVISVAVEVADDQSATTVDNTAVVTPGKTYDPDDSNNEDSDPLDTTTSADLAIVKTVSTGAPNAGEAISWLLSPSNLGPSVSVSTADSPITITDTIPDGVVEVADPSTTDWTATVTASDDGTLTFPASAGDVITWTYTGDVLEVGDAPTITLSGTVDPAWTATSGPDGDGSILNVAVISPGETDDPVDDNNTSEVTTTPGDDTTLGITKTRVVWDSDTNSWVTATDTDAVVPGETVSYRITVVNNGPADARAVTVVDETPDGLSYDSHENESGTWTRTAGGTNAAGTTDAGWDTFTLSGTLLVDATASFIVTYDIDSALDPADAIVNWAEASAENATNDPRDSDSSDQDRVSDLSIVKSHSGTATAGSTLDYTIVVTNEGPSSSSGPITVTDTLPDGFSYLAGSASVSVAGGTAVQLEPTVNGQELVWTLLTADGDTLPLDATIVIELTTEIAASTPAQTDLVNLAVVDGPEDDNPDNDSAEDPTEVVTDAEFTIVKDVADGPWIAGTEVSYTLTITNLGPSAVAATVTDTLPVGLTLVSMSGTGWDCSAAVAGEQSGTCSYSDDDGLHPVGSGNATTITVVALVASSVVTGTELTNTAEVDWIDSDGTHSDSDDAGIEVTTSADLELVKTAVDENGDEITSAVAGAAVWYRLVVSNLGPSDAVSPLTVVDTLPAGITFVALTDASAVDWEASADAVDADTGEQTVTFTRLPSGTGIAANATAEIVFEVLPAAELDADDSPLVNTATVSSGTPDPNPDNDSDDASLDISREVDLQIVKSHDAAEVHIGDELPFTLEVTNNGPSEATGITVTDTVPAGLEVVTAPGDSVGTGWTIVSVTLVDPDDTAGGAVVVASYADPLGPGAQAPALTITTLVTAAAYPDVVNLAEVSATETETDPDNNQSEDTVTVPPIVTLVIEKTAVGTFQVGSTGRYTITVENLGPTDDPGPITVEDVLPDGLSFASSPDEGVSVSGQTVTWTIDGIAAGDTVELTLYVNVGEAAYSSVTNVATVSTLSELTEDSQLSSDATVPVAAAASLSYTGVDVALWVLLALLLLALGVAVVLVVARRRTEYTE